MNTIRLIAIALPVMLLMACGGGGGGGTAAPTTPMTMMPPGTGNPNMPGTDDMMTPPPNPLAGLANVNVVADQNSPTIQAVERITGMTGANIFVSAAYQTGNLMKNDSACSATTCGITIPEVHSTRVIPFNLANPHTSLFLLNNGEFILDSIDSMVTESITLGDVTFAIGDATPTFVSASPPYAHLEFRTFAGWIDRSIFFGTTQIQIGETNPVYRFISHNAGVPATDNPSAAGGSATWEGSAVASIKADRTFILGDAEITVNFTDTNVDLMFDEWRGLDNQELSSMQPITYNDLTLANGSFTSSVNNEQVQGRFYGTNHNEVGGFFNTMDVTGAFGGTRQ